MDAEETIRHFQDMGVLRTVERNADGNILFILASAPAGYADRCMQDFSVEENQYYSGIFGIDAVTDDGIAVKMAYTDDVDDDPYENARGEDV